MKYITVSDLEKADQKEPIWALNGSADSEVGQPGEVHVGIPKINGSKIDDMHLPQSWLPVCLTDQIPRAQLLASSEFRNAVNNRLVTLISTEFAKDILSQDGVEEERTRLIEAKRTVREATAARTIQQSGADVISTSELNDAAQEVHAHDPNELAPGFLMFVDTLESKSDIEALNLIRGRGKFNRRELDHILTELHDKPKTTSFITERIGGKKK
jgi:hypothetical protein